VRVGPGRRDLRVTSFVSLLLPMLVLSRCKQAANFDQAAEFNISSLVNTTLGKILDGERTMVRAGLSLPAAGS
jgi:hypothetical protein